MSAVADTACAAGYGQRSDERVNHRNNYRHRDFDTRVGTVDVAIPKLRQGSYFQDWLLERRKRAERALTSVMATCCLLGVSTRRMESSSNHWASQPALRRSTDALVLALRTALGQFLANPVRGRAAS